MYFLPACACAVVILAIIGGAALCATRIAEIKRHHAATGRALPTKEPSCLSSPPPPKRLAP